MLARMNVQHKRCPRCRIKRTVQMGTWGLVCFNCRRPLEWAPAEIPTVVPERRAEELFTPAELERLSCYRGAILAGLYTDWPEG